MTTTQSPRLASQQVVIAAPMSLAGSAERIWKLTKTSRQPVVHVLLDATALALIALAWIAVLAWYVLFGILLVPYRIVRRGQRKRKREMLMHREIMSRSSRG